MNNLDNAQMADYMRLANLKNLYGGKLRGRADHEFADMQNPDLAGAAMPPPPMLPPPEIGNFDVRANQKIDPTTPSIDPSVYQGLQGLRSIPMTDSNEMQDPLEAIRSRVQEDPSLMGLLPEETRGMLSQTPANPQKAFVSPSSAMPEVPAPPNLQQQQPMPMNGMDAPPPNPYASIAQLPALTQQPPMESQLPPPPPIGESQLGQPLPPPQEPPPMFDGTPQPPQQQAPSEPGNVQPGSVNAAMSNPELKSEIDRIFGPIDPAMAQAAGNYEKAMDAYSQNLDDVTARLNDQEKAIKERIESRNLTTQDKILMALAVIAPLIVAGIAGGKEGVIGALGGGAKGIADVFGGRAKEAKEDDQLMSDLALEKSKVGKEKAGLPALTAGFRSKIAESIPNKELREIFNRDGQIVKDPSGKDQLVLNSGNPLLPIKGSAVRDIKDYEKLKAESHKLASSVNTLDKAHKLMDNMHDLAELTLKVRDNKNLIQKGLSIAGNKLNLYDYATGAMKAFVPATRDTVKDENGNEIKIAELMSTYRAQLADAWRDAHGNNSNAFKATEAHFDKQLPDPNSWKAFITGQSDIRQFQKQLDLVKENFDESIGYMDQLGFDTTNLRQKFGGSRRNQSQNKKASDKERAEEFARDAISKSQGQ